MAKSCTDAQALERQAEAGWLLPYLILLDSYDTNQLTPEEREPIRCEIPPGGYIGPRRWEYWFTVISQNSLPQERIPQLRFQTSPHPWAEKRVASCLEYAVDYHYQWYDETWRQLIYWLLYGFGESQLIDGVQRIPDDVKAHWYREFNLAWLLWQPCDWSAFVLQGGLRKDKRKASPWSKSTGFYATPMDVCSMMASMTFAGEQDPLIDTRLLSVCDPCVGTGSMLLLASNYSLRLFGQDIVHDLVLACKLNGYLFAPWMVYMPEATRKMLDDKYRAMMGLRRLRGIMSGDAGFDVENEHSAPAGVVVSDNSTTTALADQRREQYHEALRVGELEQMSMF